MQTVSGLRLNIGEDESVLLKKACKKIGVFPQKIKHFEITKKSLDARKKNDIHYVCSVILSETAIKKEENKKIDVKLPKGNTVVVGSGPCGLFSALYLSRNGFNPIVIERGKSVDGRKNDIDEFIRTRKLNVNSNVQFGEGGAGTFSDGKLNTGVNSPFIKEVLNEFVIHGAPKEILYLNKPHIGSDILPIVVKNIREEIIKNGGKFYFETLFSGVKTDGDKITSIICEKDNKTFEIETENLIIAIGHSSRDTYKMLYNSGFSMETKDTAVGFRIEHKQEDINIAQYGNNYDKRLPPADYKLTSNVSNRGVFTFCMCPGGYVMPATSLENAVVTNGMSNYKRDGENANSAVIVQVKKEDYDGGVLKALDYIESFEKKAFILGGSDYSVPCQLAIDFVNKRESKAVKRVKPTYPIGVKLSRLHEFYPKEYTDALINGLLDMEKRIKGFTISDAILTAPCTRTSSPVRIVRNENFSSKTFINAYPSGETGYAGGITSSAIDGIRVANSIMQKYLKNTN